MLLSGNAEGLRSGTPTQDETGRWNTYNGEEGDGGRLGSGAREGYAISLD